MASPLIMERHFQTLRIPFVILLIVYVYTVCIFVRILVYTVRHRVALVRTWVPQQPSRARATCNLAGGVVVLAALHVDEGIPGGPATGALITFRTFWVT